MSFSFKSAIGDFLPVITEELNVKEVLFKDDMTEYLEYVVKPNFKVLGKALGAKIKELQGLLQNATTEQVQKINGDGLMVSLGGDDFTITSDMVITEVKQKEGYASASNNRTCVVLETELTEELILEGLAREFVRKVQSLRKDADFVITDHIKVYYNGTEKIDEMLKSWKDYIMGEVLGEELIKDETLDDYSEMNEEKAAIKVERI